ncbi:hypothetical protein CsatA_024784 [Cannabis sativa]
MAASTTLGLFSGNTSTRIPFPKADSSSSIRVSLKTNACAVSDLGFITSQLSGLKISKDVSFQEVLQPRSIQRLLVAMPRDCTKHKDLLCQFEGHP